ncbi:HAD-IIIA family hydrolase [Niabella drilacis]|uniref:D-glycero-alpha-D-manno-heptose 1-phosphate guanylyltransferase n=1 Tax=Niabella drilacis (strain DSM 25811 / CCM 8410 / CCUG 62505 / LMG 26954 / E90) TaxID=1285928 RepID=A0A1G6LAE0_NIADE|nr:HAD-IIIA family hydrolase [Niabella drilacis]SDC40093.1 D-glycero-alpha-D-manno-heptose 1-phosphate guanylyltransferase [Niabella drilacis]
MLQKRLEGNWQNAQEAIVLAGGLGTRLREAVPDLPKCMAPVAGHPFLYYVIGYLRRQGVQRIIFSLGYKHELIEDYLEQAFPALQYHCCIEEAPLGTGGAIQLALQQATGENVLVVNGDSFFAFDLNALQQNHMAAKAVCTLALKQMHHFDRYGVVTLNETGAITSFKEKQFYETGLINAGTYLINRTALLQKPFPKKFSFENDFLEKTVSEGTLSGTTGDGYFIDIGIPQDYLRAQSDFAQKPFSLKNTDKSWTLFLDRDGVINEEKDGSYIFHTEEFLFYPGVPEAIGKFTQYFKHVIIITNQRGIGKGLMDEKALHAIHQLLNEEVKKNNGHIPAIYYATAVDSRDFFRKPNPGMALEAVKDFADIDLSRSIMVGNNISDMQFGRNAGMYTVFLTTTNEPRPLPDSLIDLQLPDLKTLAEQLP